LIREQPPLTSTATGGAEASELEKHAAMSARSSKSDANAYKFSVPSILPPSLQSDLTSVSLTAQAISAPDLLTTSIGNKDRYSSSLPLHSTFTSRLVDGKSSDAAIRATSSSAAGTRTPTSTLNRSGSGANFMSKMSIALDTSHEFESSRVVNRSISPRPTVKSSYASLDNSSRKAMRLGVGSDWDIGGMRHVNPSTPRQAASVVSSSKSSPQRSTSMFEPSIVLSAAQRSSLFNNLPVTPRRPSISLSTTSPDDSTASVLNQSQALPPSASRYSMLRICENLPRQLYSRRSL